MHFWFAQLQQFEDYLASGGVTMLPLLLVSLVIWFLIGDRMLYFSRMQYKGMSPEEALEHIAAERLPDRRRGGGLLGLLVSDFLMRRSSDGADDRLIDELVTVYSRKLTSYLALIGVLAAIAPLLGLLGTVIGMMDAFNVLALFGNGNASALAGGISAALISTQSGLLVAIPGLYMKGLLERRAALLQQQLRLVGYSFKRELEK
jgi:biopolymer transport protein ExbB